MRLAARRELNTANTVASARSAFHHRALVFALHVDTNRRDSTTGCGIGRPRSPCAHDPI